MKTKFFIKHLTMFLLPMMIPIIILGSLAILISQNYIKEDINKNSVNVLRQTKENIELMLSETDPMRLVYDNDLKIIDTLSSIMRNRSLTHEELISYDLLKSFLSAPSNARPYIDSFYVYMDNDNGRFVSSKQGLSDIATYTDADWFEAFKRQDEGVKLWIEPRFVKTYAQDMQPARIVTIFQRINEGRGVLVLNIAPGYIENILKSLSTFPDQCILVVNEKNEIVFSDKRPAYLQDLPLARLTGSEQSFFTADGAGDAFIVSQLESKRYGWKYISIVPQRALYQVPLAIVKITILLLLLSFALGFGLAFYMTRQSYKQIFRIIRIIDSAESGSPLPVMSDRVKDEYGYIIQNIVKTFIEQSYLKVQLSERRYKLEAAQLTALQSQINPHFLFNTLETVNWETIALTGKPNQVTRIIDRLSEILRYSLTNPMETVTLATELNRLKSYLDIQAYRYDNKFNVLWDVDAEAESCKVMKLLLQPFVENSIYHGIKEKEAQGVIKIRVRRSGARLRLAVIDDGLGMSRELLRCMRQELGSDKPYSEHIGLYNTNKRLQLVYGEAFGITLRSKEGWGTAVYMTLPASEG